MEINLFKNRKHQKNDAKISDVFASIDRSAFDGEVILKKGKKIFIKL